MPPLPVIANHYLVTQRVDDLTHERHQMVNVLCVDDGGAAPTHSAIATKVAAAWAAHIMPFCSAAFTMGNTDVLPLDGTSSTTSFATPSAGTAGGHGTGNGMPNAVAMVVAWQTGQRGKSKRGRSYIAGVTDDMVTNVNTNSLTPTQINAIGVGANAFLVALASVPNPLLLPKVLSRTHGIATFITNARADAQLGIQRRRYEKVARH